MENLPVIIEHPFFVSAAVLWNAITRKEEMKHWYFDIAEFKPDVGFEFSFLAGNEKENLYLHVCKIIEIIQERKLSYTWRFEGYEGNSLLSFELFEEGSKTTLKVTHEGVHTFAPIGEGFSKQNFEEGWSHLINIALKNYLEVKYMK